MKKEIHIKNIQMSVVKFILPININWELTPKNNDTIITFEEKYQNIICKYLYNNLDLIITKDNIHLYYEFMSDEDLEKYQDIISNLLLERQHLIIYKNNEMKIVKEDCKYCESKFINSYCIYNCLFGVKDTLKPIDDYIEEIKASNEYKEYIKNNQ